MGRLEGARCNIGNAGKLSLLSGRKKSSAMKPPILVPADLDF
jgi:hypothetical protein